MARSDWMGSLAQYCTHAMRRSIKHGSNISVEGYMSVGTKKNRPDVASQMEVPLATFLRLVNGFVETLCTLHLG